MSVSIAYLGLGANLADRRGAIESALAALAETPGIEVAALSALIETEPIGPPGQGRYLNAAAKLQTTLSPRRLLAACRRIEADHGRDRRTERRWGPRPLDLDLLLYDARVINEPGLEVPHPRLPERAFVLEPLAEIAASVKHPVLGVSIEELRQRLRAAPAGNTPPGRGVLSLAPRQDAGA